MLCACLKSLHEIVTKCHSPDLLSWSNKKNRKQQMKPHTKIFPMLIFFAIFLSNAISKENKKKKLQNVSEK